jgi:hypothetical protein
MKRASLWPCLIIVILCVGCIASCSKPTIGNYYTYHSDDPYKTQRLRLNSDSTFTYIFFYERPSGMDDVGPDLLYISYNGQYHIINNYLHFTFINVGSQDPPEELKKDSISGMEFRLDEYKPYLEKMRISHRGRKIGDMHKKKK